MNTRRLEIDSHRIERWVLGFADRHDGARVLAAGGTDGDDSPAVESDDRGCDDDKLTLAGGDGAIAQLSRWAGSGPAAPARGDHPVTSARGADPAGRAGHSRTRDASSAARPRGQLDEHSAAEIAAWATPPVHLGLILVRRGGYAVGLSNESELLTHKSGTRYVQSRTAAGGWSQQRFARRRGNQASALVSTVVEHATRLLAPAPTGTAQHRPSALVLGGDRALATELMEVPALSALAALPRRELPDLPDPRHRVLIEALRRGRCVPVLLTEPH